MTAPIIKREKLLEKLGAITLENVNTVNMSRYTWWLNGLFNADVIELTAPIVTRLKTIFPTFEP